MSEGPEGRPALGAKSAEIALAVFFFQNGEDASVDFLWFDGQWPLWAVIGISVLIGIVLDRLVTWQWRRARRHKASR